MQGKKYLFGPGVSDHIPGLGFGQMGMGDSRLSVNRKGAGFRIMISAWRPTARCSWKSLARRRPLRMSLLDTSRKSCRSFSGKRG